MKDKECLHNWIFVYSVGLEIECEKCSKEIYKTYIKEDADYIISKITK
jgi:phage FluMu protein Com